MLKHNLLSYGELHEIVGNGALGVGTNGSSTALTAMSIRVNKNEHPSQ